MYSAYMAYLTNGQTVFNFLPRQCGKLCYFISGIMDSFLGY